MNFLHCVSLLAEANFGAGFGAGIGAGMAIGIGAGTGAGTGGARKKMERQLTTAIESGEIAVFDKDGQALTVESVLQKIQSQSCK
ncbi:MAG: hypothetical protein AAGG48_27870 [Planctomycetota bacterium]